VERSDSRSVEELLSFIEEGGSGGAGGSSSSSPPSSAKKKKKKAKTAPTKGSGGGGGSSATGQQRQGGASQCGSGEWDVGGSTRPDQAARGGSGGLGPRAGSQDLARLLASRPVDELMDELFPEDGFEDSGGCRAGARDGDVAQEGGWWPSRVGGGAEGWVVAQEGGWWRERVEGTGHPWRRRGPPPARRRS
jgi:hypothetical protein